MAWVTRLPGGIDDLRHGYTLADLHRFARASVYHAGPLAMDWGDRYDTAYSAIAEHLYTVEQPPPEHDLIAVGRDAIWRLIRDYRHHHGYYRDTDGVERGAQASPAFCQFWLHTTRTPSPEARIVDAHTVQQVLPMLSVRQRQVIQSLAVFEDYERAAISLGMTYVNFVVTLSQARRRFLYWWHEGELPSRPWGTDRRRGAPTSTKIIRKREQERRYNPAPTRVLRPTDRRVGVWTGYRTHCPAGHAYDEENTYVDRLGYRHCRQCKRDRRKARSAGGEGR